MAGETGLADKIMARRRETGRVGMCDHVIVLPVEDISNEEFVMTELYRSA